MRRFIAAIKKVGFVFVLICLMGCGGTQRPSQCVLLFTAKPSGASIYVDEKFVSTARHPIEVACGMRRISVTASGYFPHDFTLPVKPGHTKIRVSLRLVPKS